MSHLTTALSGLGTASTMLGTITQQMSSLPSADISSSTKVSETIQQYLGSDNLGVILQKNGTNQAVLLHPKNYQILTQFLLSIPTQLNALITLANKRILEDEPNWQRAFYKAGRELQYCAIGLGIGLSLTFWGAYLLARQEDSSTKSLWKTYKPVIVLLSGTLLSATLTVYMGHIGTQFLQMTQHLNASGLLANVIK